jgi:catechol 2,3-dioxygenase-like lactoylglutathione lyase family enzyme
MALLRIDGFNVLTVYVTDVDASLRFYEEILGFRRSREMSPGWLLRHEIAGLTLYLEGGRRPREAAGTKHPVLAMCLNSGEGVNRARDKLKSVGVKIVQEYGDDKFAGVQFEDPSGNLIEVAGKP